MLGCELESVRGCERLIAEVKDKHVLLEGCFEENGRRHIRIQGASDVPIPRYPQVRRRGARWSERVFNDLSWLTLISGILMMVPAFWVSGQFFLERAYTLLVFAGIWTLMAGITDIVRAFQIRRLASDS